MAALVVLWGAGEQAAQAQSGDGGAASGPVFAWILLDAQTGQVLSEQNADVLTYPASLTKMMTLYLTFEALDQGRIRTNQLLRVSAEAASRAPSKLGLRPGDAVPLSDLIPALVTRSANDAAAVIAENLAGSEENFARYMTWKARQLGMQRTWFRNASGLPDPGQRTTARDMARLSLALYHDFPREYRYFSTQGFYFRGDPIHTHNHLLKWYAGADGIKTGFINASGFNIATSAVRNGRRLIGVIMGGRSARSRDLQMASLLDQGFTALGQQPLVASAPAAGPRASSTGTIAASAPTAPAAAPVATPTASSTGAIAAMAPIPARPAPAPTAGAIAAAKRALASNEEDDGRKPDTLNRVASNALRHLAPVAKAQASSTVHLKTVANDEWSIQLGAFRDQSAARQVLRRAAGIAAMNGKPQQVLAPAKSERPGFYRARVLRFSENGARAACAELTKRKMACTVIQPATKLARG